MLPYGAKALRCETEAGIVIQPVDLCSPGLRLHEADARSDERAMAMGRESAIILP